VDCAANPAGLWLSWNAEAGRSYEIEGATGLSGTWQPLKSVVANSNTANATLPMNSNSCTFYRVRVLP
jgi:hypothetical protein